MLVNEWLFYGICAMAAIGVIQAIWTLASSDSNSSPFDGARETPEGFEWVLRPKSRE